MTHLIVSCSLNSASKSDILAEHLHNAIANSSLIRLRDLDLPLCDASSCYENKTVQRCQELVTQAQSIVVCSPIYNYDVNAAAKNFNELTGQGWREKVVSLAVAAGGNSSYMAPLSFANSLMIDFRCIINPRFVYATGAAFDEHNSISDDGIKERLAALASKHVELSDKLND